MLVCHCGDPRHGNDLLRPLRALKPQEDKVRVMSYLEAQSGAGISSSARRAFPNGPVSSGTQRGRDCDDHNGNQRCVTKHQGVHCAALRRHYARGIE